MRQAGRPADRSEQHARGRSKAAIAPITVAQINARYNPADWFPSDHPPMPDIVAHGKEANGVRACGICHLPNGKGLMQNGSVSGLPRDYILQQLGDFKSGKRHTADPNKANGYEMQAIARNLTDDEAQAAADYFSSVKYTKWVRVVESETVPKFTATVNGLFLEGRGNDTMPLGNRIVEMPEDTYQTNILRNPRSGFVAYAPVGSLKKGEALVAIGEMRHVPRRRPAAGMMVGEGHRPDRSQDARPGYIGRALYDFQQGARSGANAALMKPSVQKLTEDDAIAISAYVSPQSARAVDARITWQLALRSNCHSRPARRPERQSPPPASFILAAPVSCAVIAFGPRVTD